MCRNPWLILESQHVRLHHEFRFGVGNVVCEFCGWWQAQNTTSKRKSTRIMQTLMCMPKHLLLQTVIQKQMQMQKQKQGPRHEQRLKRQHEQTQDQKYVQRQVLKHLQFQRQMYTRKQQMQMASKGPDLLSQNSCGDPMPTPLWMFAPLEWNLGLQFCLCCCIWTLQG